MNSIGSALLSWLGSGSGGDLPAAGPLAWAALAAARRELGSGSGYAGDEEKKGAFLLHPSFHPSLSPQAW